MNFIIEIATEQHFPYADAICDMYAHSAKQRGTGIAKRKPEYIREKMLQQKGVIAFGGTELAGFCYIETWSHEKYVANSGLITSPNFRKMGLAKAIKQKVFQLARDRHPSARIFGITTSLAVMKINSELGYKPVTFSELTQDEAFWKGCQSCPNYDVLLRNERQLCLCTGMLAPSKEEAIKHDLTKMIIK